MLQQEALKHRLDAHLHLQTIPLDSGFKDESDRDITDTFLIKGSKSISNGTSPFDWDLLASLAKLYPLELVPYYGVHPWYVDSLPKNWLELLKFYLVEFNYGIGEIGLDRSSFSKAAFSLQLEIFEIQLDLAVSMNIPVTVHCIRSWGILLETLKNKVLVNNGSGRYCKVPVMIHSFSGSMEIMKHLTSFGVYLSFSPFLLTEKAGKLESVFRSVSLQNILIESDFTVIKNKSIANQAKSYNLELQNLYKKAAELKNMDPFKFREMVYNNGKIFTDRTLNRKK